jgi:urease accessory protein
VTASIAPLLLADGRLPTGGHAHSAGLEPALAAGMPAAQVPDYLRARLLTVGRVEAAATVLSHRAARQLEVAHAEKSWNGTESATGPRGHRGPGDLVGLAEIQAELLARTPSAPLREASGQLGRGLARLVSRTWPGAAATAALSALQDAPQRPVALGVATALSGMDETQAARACLYDDAQSVASAALKLLPVDPLDPVGWLLAAAPLIDQITTEAAAVTDLACLPSTTGPLIEQWSLAHHLTQRRIFRA